MTSEYAATRKQFNKSLAEFGMIQVQSPRWNLKYHPFSVWSKVNELCVFVGEVCSDGPECLCDGKHGLPDSRDDGQTGTSRLFSGGCNG